MNRRLLATLPLLLAFAAAQTPSPLKLVLSTSLVTTVTQNGRTEERLTPNPRSVLPGALVQQTLTVTNTSTRTLRGAVVRLPVPKNAVYAGALRNAEGATAQFSFDNAKTFGTAPLKRRITVTENGQSVTREVTVNPNEYTDVRWTLPALTAGQSVQLSYRITVK
ncbi:hypothetical protein [Deinococcus maricopensis]|uniref:DUF11 domain-containing protein n=1 Tax=Deinococcus maricopensis (strain DSM 21211 / LMG 22137 / NRRL B-23946 / LB-34) TaxID=709986 RepID=E8UBZ7_DEIML|nr:hypothetical protein [Deinococcus maricopensis]ADV68586.1 hypothetical protein Deima_2957 [Deinococcus maricopensis DSM 21211]